MKFRNYCVVIMGDTKNVMIEIEKVSEIKPNILDAKGILISTFSSSLEPSELTDWFKLNKRSFLLFDLDKDMSGYNIMKSEIHQGLFGFVDTINLIKMGDEFLKAIDMSSDTKTSNNYKHSVKKNIKIKDSISEDKILKMTRKEKDDMWNKIMDNGVENLTEYDKKLLQMLSK